MRKKESQVKICPLIKQQCLGSGCQLFNPVVENCEISVLSYNLYKLSQAEKQRLNSEVQFDNGDNKLNSAPMLNPVPFGAGHSQQ